MTFSPIFFLFFFENVVFVSFLLFGFFLLLFLLVARSFFLVLSFFVTPSLSNSLYFRLGAVSVLIYFVGENEK